MSKTKSVLIIDTPSRCGECILCHGRMNFKKEYIIHFCSKVFDTGKGDVVLKHVDPEKPRPDWCPLSSLPERINLCQYVENGAVGLDGILAYQFAQGWNDFREEILKGDIE